MDAFDGTSVTTAWFQPHEWRTHLLADEPYFVAEEVMVLVGDVLVDQLSWSSPLVAEQRQDYDDALQIKASL